MSDLPLPLDPIRSAHASIQGYLYQAYLGVERWLDLQDTEVLRCEGDEDLDRLLRDGTGGRSEQVKSLTGAVSIRDQVVKNTLRRFAVSHYLLHTTTPSSNRNFVFTTTATRKRQKVTENEPDVLESWELAKIDGRVQGRVIEFLRKTLPFSDSAEDNDSQQSFRRQIQAALAWLEDNPNRWADLIQSVEWHLGEPRLTEVRGRLRQKVAQRWPLCPPELLYRLLSEVLDASSAPNPVERVRTREQLEAIVSDAEDKVANWLKTARGQRLLQAVDEVDDLGGILYPKSLGFDDLKQLNRPPRPGELLTASFEVIPFNEKGRAEILDDLAAWCGDDRRTLVRLIYGDGGLGKTRLFIEWCRRLSAQGWLSGFLDPDLPKERLERITRGMLPRLVVIDYAEARLDIVRTLIGRLSRFTDGPKIRLALLARHAGDWWRGLEADAEVAILLGRTMIWELRPTFSDIEDRQAAFQTAVRAFSSSLDMMVPGEFPSPNLTAEAFGRPLYLHMAALLAVERYQTTNPEDALLEILRRERLYWKRTIGGLNVDEETRIELSDGLEKMVTVLTLLGGIGTQERTQELAQKFLPPQASTAKHKLLAELIHRLYAAPTGSGSYISGLEPDLLGEQLLSDSIGTDLRLLDVALDLADASGRLYLLSELTRLAQRKEYAEKAEEWLRHTFATRLDEMAEQALEAAITVGDPIGKVLAPFVDEQASVELAERLMEKCNAPDFRDSIPLREVARSATQRSYLAVRERLPRRSWLAAWWRWLFPTNEDLDLRARLAYCAQLFADLNNSSEGLRAAQEAVRIRHWLARKNPEVFIPVFAQSLASLAVKLGKEKMIHKAINIFRGLTAKDSETHLADLARVLTKRVAIRQRLGQTEEAIKDLQESVDIYRSLAQKHPNRFAPLLALGLNNLGACMRDDLDRPQDAALATQEAIRILRGLADSRPDIFLPDLAMSLRNIGVQLGDMNRHQEALANIREATEIYKLLALRRTTFQSELAVALNSLGSQFKELDRREEALKFTLEAVHMQRSLPPTERALSDLTISLSNLGIHLRSLGRFDEAIRAQKEAVSLCRQLAIQSPESNRHRLPSLLTSLGITCSIADYHRRAIEAHREAIEIYRLLESSKSPAFRPSALAASLSSKGVSLRSLGYTDEALDNLQESVTIRRELASQEPERFLMELPYSLNNLASLKIDLKHSDALEISREAVNLFRQLAEQNPGFIPDLANSLHNLSFCLSAVGQFNMALESADEGIKLLEPFFFQYPKTYRNSMSGLVSAYSMSCKATGIDPRRDTLHPILELLGQLDAGKRLPQQPEDRRNGPEGIDILL